MQKKARTEHGSALSYFPSLFFCDIKNRQHFWKYLYKCFSLILFTFNLDNWIPHIRLRYVTQINRLLTESVDTNPLLYHTALDIRKCILFSRKHFKKSNWHPTCSKFIQDQEEPRVKQPITCSEDFELSNSSCAHAKWLIWKVDHHIRKKSGVCIELGLLYININSFWLLRFSFVIVFLTFLWALYWRQL